MSTFVCRGSSRIQHDGIARGVLSPRRLAACRSTERYDARGLQPKKRPCRAVTQRTLRPSRQRCQQCLGLLQVGYVKLLGGPAIVLEGCSRVKVREWRLGDPFRPKQYFSLLKIGCI